MHTSFPICILNSLLILNKIKYAFLFHIFRIDSLPPPIIRNRSKFKIPRAKTTILKFLTKHKNIACAFNLQILILNSLHFIQAFRRRCIFRNPYVDFVRKLLLIMP